MIDSMGWVEVVVGVGLKGRKKRTGRIPQLDMRTNNAPRFRGGNEIVHAAPPTQSLLTERKKVMRDEEQVVREDAKEVTEDENEAEEKLGSLEN